MTKFGHGVEDREVFCELFPEVRRSYAVCIHIKNPADVSYVDRASGEEPGLICCALCLARWSDEAVDDEELLDQFSIICEGCAHQKGLLGTAVTVN